MLILGCTLAHDEDSASLRLSGPGIIGTTTITVGRLPDSLWELRQQTQRFPLGWDIVLVADDQVIGIPRSVTIQRLNVDGRE
jgi:alpha-D-ribose 1-methylphosphonate 5-triphosphate synthase subunit PhnH